MTRSANTVEALLESLDVIAFDGPLDSLVSGLQTDSRRVGEGQLFIALVGQAVDGHRFVGQAAEQGALGALVSRPLAEFEDARPPVLIQVSDTARAVAPLAASFYGQPSRELRLVGITGTNGKTTLTYLLEQVLLAAGLCPGIIGTINHRWPGHSEDNPHTTPQAVELQSLLRRMVDDGVECAVLEVSSHALELGRVRQCHFQVAGFTNLSRDHLDFHGDLDTYARAKALLFGRELMDSQAPDRVAVVNGDDARSAELVSGFSGPVVRFGMGPQHDVHPLGQAVQDLTGTRAQVAFPGGSLLVQSALTGRHNLENILATVALARALGISGPAIAKGLAAAHTVPGRLERVAPESTGPAVFVDYAHTDHALQNVLAALRPLTSGRLLTVFGCGGDRDKGKRPLMGSAVAAGADLAVVTSDNPRSESPLSIIEGILPGLDQGGFAQVEPAEFSTAEGTGLYCVLPDRRAAIELAVSHAGPDDVVLIAGKGHEDYQIVGDQRRHFDDRQEALRVLGIGQTGAQS